MIEKSIKWSRDLKNDFDKKRKINYNPSEIAITIYRPYIKKFLHYNRLLCDVLTDNHFRYYGNSLSTPNPTIIISSGQRAEFGVYSSNLLPNLDVFMPNGTKILPFYSTDQNGETVENMTNWGLNQFIKHYKSKKITKFDIFNYVYAVLHNPEYRKKYALNLKREFPRVPYHTNFQKWAALGKELMDLHINYETVDEYPLETVTIAEKVNPKTKLKADKISGQIQLDENTILKGIPPIVWKYKLGNRSALDWVIDQYKESKPRDETIGQLFNPYHFKDEKNHVIGLIKRVSTISLRTMEIIRQMETL